METSLPRFFLPLLLALTVIFVFGADHAYSQEDSPSSLWSRVKGWFTGGTPNEAHELSGKEANGIVFALADLEMMASNIGDNFIYLSLPKSLLDSLSEAIAGATYTPGDQGDAWAVQFDTLSIKPDWGRLAFDSKATVLVGPLSLPVVLSGHFVADKNNSGLNAKLMFYKIGLDREVFLDRRLPDWAAPILTGETLRVLNERLPSIPLPVAQDFVLAAQEFPKQDLELPLPDGGTLVGALTLPPLPEIRRSLNLRSLIPTPTGVLLVAEIAGGGAPISDGPQSSRTEGSDAAGAIAWTAPDVEARWKETMESISLVEFVAGLPEPLTVVVGEGVFNRLFEEVSALPEVHRTVTFQGVSSTGNIISKTGGAPFGNGFKLYFSGADRASGRGLLSALRVDFAEGAVNLSGTASVSASAQLHFHGNAPQVTKRVFGVKIIDVKVGGGVGTSFGVSAGSGDRAVTGTLTPVEGAAELGFTLTAPSEVPIAFDIGGVPGEVEGWLKDQFKAKLPTGTALARIQLPDLIAPKFQMPSDSPLQLKQSVPVSASAPHVKITEKFLFLRSVVDLDLSPPADEARP